MYKCTYFSQILNFEKKLLLTTIFKNNEQQTIIDKDILSITKVTPFYGTYVIHVAK